MFEKEPQSVRAAVLVLVLAAMPVETHYNTMFPAGADEIEEHQVNSIDSEVESYTNVVIFKLIDELKLSEEFFEGYMSLIKDDYSSLSTNYSSDSSELTPYGRSDRDAMINTFKIVVESQSENSADDDENRYKLCDLRMKIIIEVLLFLVINNFYDGRGRVIIRNLTKLLECSPVDMVLLESILAHSLVQQLGLPGGKDIEAKEDNEDVDVKKKKKAVRYMKIGAVSLGAGAILAVTGGLAAPALAAAAVVVFGTGGAAVAGAATVTVLGTVFGSAGAGLTGYKMMRRTSGLNEFEFEPCNGPVGIDSEGQVTDKDGDSTNCNSLAVMICISGWMNEREDHRRVFGILPKFNSNITARERLSRFYMMHNPHQLLSIDEEVKQYELNPEAYAAHIADVYNIDIENDIEGALLPPPFPSASAQNLWAEASEGMGDCVAYMSNSMALRLNPEKKNAASTEKTMQSDSCEPTASSATESKANPNAAQSNLRQLASKSGKAAAGDGGYGSGLIVNDQITAEDGITFRDRYWNWRDCELSSSYDMYLLRYETDLQLELGRCIRKLMKDLTASATQQLLTVTVFAALMSAVLLPVTLIKMTDMIDSTWTLAIERADMAGVELAHALAGRLQGTRPVTLVGHSIGARVVYSCLKELYRLKTVEQQKFEADKRAKGVAVAQEDAVEIQDDVVEYANTGVKESNADCDAEPPTRTAKSVIEDNKESGFFSKWRAKLSATTTTTSNSNSKEYGLGDDSVEPPPRFLSKYDGIIQDVVILGAPINSTSPNWSLLRSMVSGRFINGYSTRDLVLALVYRYERWKITVAGVQPVTGTKKEHATTTAMNELSQSGRFSENLSLNDAAGAAPNASVTDDLNSGKKAIPSEGKSVVNSIGIENVDLSFLIGKHTDYCYKMDTILKYLDLKSTTVNSSIHGVGYGVAKNPMHESDSNAVDV